MSSIVDVPITELCRDASPETVTAFVADLYEARGWTGVRDGDRRLVVSDGEQDKRVAIVHPDDALSVSDLVGWADTVVLVGGGYVDTGDCDVVDTTTLRRQLAYAVDRSVARRLLQSHFDWSPVTADDAAVDSTETPSIDTGYWVGGPVDTRLPRSVAGRTRLLLAAALLVAVAGGVAVAVGDELGRQDTAAAGSTASATPTPTPEVGTATEVSPTPSVRTPVTPEAQRTVERPANLAPGIDESGNIDRERLVKAHKAVLENESYRMSLTYREFVDGRPTGVHSETLWVVNGSEYRASVSKYGTLRMDRFSIASGDVYANGSVRYRRINQSAVASGRAHSFDWFAGTQTGYLHAFLSVRNSSVVDRGANGRVIYLRTDGNTGNVISNTTGGVIVTDEGVIRDAVWSFDFIGGAVENEVVSATIRMQVSDVGSTTVQEPAWVNRTAAS